MGLLGEALLIAPGAPGRAAAAIAELLADDVRRARMGAIGRDRMGGAGGARAIAASVVTLAGAA
jgi:hypothetical protein